MFCLLCKVQFMFKIKFKRLFYCFIWYLKLILIISKVIWKAVTYFLFSLPVGCPERIERVCNNNKTTNDRSVMPVNYADVRLIYWYLMIVLLDIPTLVIIVILSILLMDTHFQYFQLLKHLKYIYFISFLSFLVFSILFSLVYCYW